MGSERKPTFISAKGYVQEMAIDDTATFGGLTLSGALAMGTNKVTGMGDPSDPQDAATKAYVDLLITTGGRIKEALLDANQLDNTDGINAAEVLFFAAQPAHDPGDTVVFKNGTLTRTYTFVENIAAESAATDVSKETSAVTAMQRLVTRMNADAGNTQWTAVFRATGMERINADGAIVVYEKASAAGASDSRIYGVWGTQASAKVVAFASGATPTVATEYTSTTSATMAASDPGAGRFGLRRETSALVDCEIHCVLNNETLYAWDSDTSEWVTLSGSSALPDATAASGGGVKGKITVDSDFGLAVASGVLSINLSSTPGLEFVTDGAVKKLQAKIDGSSITLNGSGKLQATPDVASYNVGAAVAAGDPLYFSAADTVSKADTTDTSNKANVVGVSLDGQGTVGQPTKVVRAGAVTGVLSSASPGAEYWLATSGGLTATIPGSGKRLIRVGFAINTTDLDVRIQDFGLKA